MSSPPTIMSTPMRDDKSREAESPETAGKTMPPPGAIILESKNGLLVEGKMAKNLSHGSGKKSRLMFFKKRQGLEPQLTVVSCEFELLGNIQVLFAPQLVSHQGFKPH
jgi:hypothetical protein